MNNDIIPEQNDTRDQKDELKDADPCACLDSASAHVEPDDNCKEYGSEFEVDPCDDAEQGTGRHQLNCTVEQGVEHRCDHNQPADTFIVVVI